jgi:hypothetical protein
VNCWTRAAIGGASAFRIRTTRCASALRRRFVFTGSQRERVIIVSRHHTCKAFVPESFRKRRKQQ